MEEDLQSFTKKKLIELAKHRGLSTSGTKSDILDRLEQHRSKSKKKKKSKKLTDEEYYRQKQILEQDRR